MDSTLNINEVAKLWDTTPTNVRRFLRKYRPEIRQGPGRWEMSIDACRRLGREMRVRRRH